MAVTQEKGYPDPEWLREMVGRGLSQREIAEEAGVSQPSISYHMDKHGVEPATPVHKDPNWLRGQVSRGQSQREIAQEAEVSVYAIWYQMKKHGIEPVGANGT